MVFTFSLISLVKLVKQHVIFQSDVRKTAWVFVLDKKELFTWNFLWIIVTKKLLSSLGNGWFLRLLVSCHLFSPPSIWKSPWEAAWQDDRSIFIGERPVLVISKIDNGSHVFNSILLCYLWGMGLIIYLHYWKKNQKGAILPCLKCFWPNKIQRLLIYFFNNEIRIRWSGPITWVESDKKEKNYTLCFQLSPNFLVDD